MKLLFLLFSVQCFAVDRIVPLRFDISSLEQMQLIRSVSDLAPFVQIKPEGISPYAMTSIVHSVQGILGDGKMYSYVVWKPKSGDFEIVTGINGAMLFTLRPLQAVHFMPQREVLRIHHLSEKLKDAPVRKILKAMQFIPNMEIRK